MISLHPYVYFYCDMCISDVYIFIINLSKGYKYNERFELLILSIYNCAVVILTSSIPISLLSTTIQPMLTI